jgi:hypothetical protein
MKDLEKTILNSQEEIECKTYNLELLKNFDKKYLKLL